MNKYLIVVDVQNDFVDKALGTKEAVAIIPRVKEKIREYKKEGAKIIFTRDTHTSEYLNTNEGKYLPIEHCIKNSDGWQIYEGLDTENAEIIDKPSFGYLDWSGHIERTDDLYIELIGLCTDICVVSNALILSVTGLEPAMVSLTAFYIAALCLFLQGVSLAANFSLRRIKNSAAETFNPLN